MSDLDVRFELNPAAIFQNCPEDSGVYTIESAEGDVLWIAYSRNLTQGVTKHLPENELRNEVVARRGRFFRFFLTEDTSYLAQIFDAYVQRKGRFPLGMTTPPEGSRWVGKSSPGESAPPPATAPAASDHLPHVAAAGRPGEGMVLGSNPAPRAMAARETPLNILLVDDDVQLLVLMKELLEVDGHKVYAAANKKMLSEALKVNPVHVLILDYHLSDLTAEQVIQAVLGRHPRALVLLITGTHQKEEAYGLLELGVKKIFPKPFSMKMLSRSILEHFGREPVVRTA